MKRSILPALVLIGLNAAVSLAQEVPTASAPPRAAGLDEIGEEAARLETELGKFNETTPEAADTMAKLVDLYHADGRMFGLIRVAQKFVAAHPGDKRHASVMLKLVDGLEATSRNKELTVIARQFLTRYPEAQQCAAIELRLAHALDQLNDLPAAAEAYAAVWKRNPGKEMRDDAARAVWLDSQSGNRNHFLRGAELAEDLLDKLPAGEFTALVGIQAVHQWRRGNEWARSNLVANTMLKKGLPADKTAQRELHYYMAENYGNLGQHANAVESLKQARGLEDSPVLHLQQIVRMHHAGATAAEMEPIVNQYVQAYPIRPDRFQASSYLVLAFLRGENKPRALQLLASLLPHDAVTNNNASLFVRENGSEPQQLAATERTLLDALSKNERHAWYLRYVLAFELYRDRLKDPAKTRQMLREFVTKSPTNDHYARYAVDWLLGNAADENEFKAEVARLIAARREYVDYGNFRGYLATWAKNARRNKELSDRAEYVTKELKKADEDPVVALWLEIEDVRSNKSAAVREKLLAPALFNQLNDRMARTLLQQQGEYYWHYAPSQQRPIAATTFGQMVRRFPRDYQAALWYLHTAIDHSPPEVGKEAALHLLSLEPEWNQIDAWYRLMLAADRNQDPALALKAHDWIRKSQGKFGKDPTYGSFIGDVLAKYNHEAAAKQYWTDVVALNRNHHESRDCAGRLLALLEEPARPAFIRELMSHHSDFHGRYAGWLADIHFKAGDLDQWEAVLREARQRQDERPFRGWDLDENIAQQWVDVLRADKEAPVERRRRVFTVVRDLDILRTSASAELALYELDPDFAESPVQRMLAYQATTRKVGNDSHDWDRLMPYVQATLNRQDYVAAATLLTGMLSNLTNVEPGRTKTGRELVAQCYSRMGGVGVAIDETSPLAPLMQAALYLRLGDQRLAFDTYVANKALFDAHRNEVPPDLLLFVCERLTAAGGDENHEQVEAILRGWVVRNSEATHIEPSMKARVQLLLGRNFFKARRYDLARTELTTVINRYPETPQAIEAEFGIGETFMAQKVYDQAQAVFEKLANHKDADVVVRAEFLRGVLAHRRGDGDEARDIFKAVLDRVPNIELANQALFNLAEVYGDEERYIEQLNLLRTVGRLGRASKRWHQPGLALSIVVQDGDLGISRGHNKIPVRVVTEPGGDEETIYLTSGGAGKGLFRADLDTRLGQVTKNDKTLQLTGNDVIRCDYPDEFKAEFRHVPLSDVEIRIAADAKLEMASSKIVDAQEETFSERLEREAREREDQRVSQGRPANQVKPGNLVYFRVQDGDRDLSEERDDVVVRLEADSGDQVQVTLAETESHSGIFEGTARTGELPAGALASDTAIEHSPLMAIDRDPDSAWVSEPDGATPKWLTVDMKDLRFVSRVRLFTPNAERNAPVRGTIYGSNDGLYWFRVAANPPEPRVETGFAESGPMTRRVYPGNYTRYTEWNQILNLCKNGKPIEEAEVEGELTWGRTPDMEEADKAAAVVWNGKLVQERSGTARFVIHGTRTALVVDGRLEIPLGPGGRHADVWLDAGAHEITIFAATDNGTRPVTALWSQADHQTSRILLRPFRASDFDLSLPAAQTDRSQSSPEDDARVSVAGRSWEFRFLPVELRFVRFVIHEYLGEAVAINHVEVTGEEPDEVYIPTETDVLALSTNDVLEIAGGDVITATYADEFTQSQSGRSRLLNAQLTATYFNARATPIAYNFREEPNGAVTTVRKELMRIDPGERIIFEVVDYDLDASDAPDALKFQVFVNDGAPIEFTATETERYSGVFTKEVDTSTKAEDGKLQVKPGDRIYCRYLDAQNTFPGHAVPREAVVYVNEPSAGQIRIYETRIVPPPSGSEALPRVVYRQPARDVEMSGIAFEAPLTVEVIDPDAARDSLSSVVVQLTTTDGATVDVRCVVSNAFVPGQQNVLDNWPLREGRFVGQVILQLGGKNSPQTVPLTSDMPRNLVGGPAIDEERANAVDRTLITNVLNLTGKDIVTATYRDEQRPARPATGLAATGRLISNGQLAVTDRDYEKPAVQLHVGERMFLMVTDADRDTSDDRDLVEVEISTEFGEQETVLLAETLAHSGVFTGSVSLRPSRNPTAGNIDVADPLVETYFGDLVHARYVDKAASTESGELEVLIDVPVVIGTDGLVAAFSKTFNDETLAVETKFHIAESYFELFKSHKNLGREEEQKSDLEAGRRVLREVMEDYSDPKYVPRIAYLLGQFSQELGHWSEAIESYEMIVRQYPEHSLAADAQYKLAQSHEEAGNFDQALEAYVTLAATYPKSPLIASVMIRISDHFYQAEEYDIAAQVGEKFLDRFDSHQYASRIAFRIGQCHFKGKTYPQAGEAFDQFVKRFPDDTLCSDALFWAGESFRMGNNNREAFRRYNRCRWDFPESESAKYARGRLALPEMLQQFEAEANSIDMDN